MNVLDENIPESQYDSLKRRRVPVRQIGQDIGQKGMKDDEVIRLLRELQRPTLFTLDADYYDRKLCHSGYSLVHLDVEEALVAEYVRRFLRHRELNSKAKRLGCVIQVSPVGLKVWRIRAQKESRLSWS